MSNPDSFIDEVTEEVRRDRLFAMFRKYGWIGVAIVLEDVDVRETAQAIFGNAFFNNGQVCLAVKRAYVHADIYDAMCGELARLAEEAVVDDGLQQGTQLLQACVDQLTALRRIGGYAATPDCSNLNALQTGLTVSVNPDATVQYCPTGLQCRQIEVQVAGNGFNTRPVTLLWVN